MYGYIYKTTNLVNGMIYIGQKKSKIFLGNKYLGSGKRLHEAIRKYGEKSFSVDLLEEIEDIKDIDDREIYWINKYNSTDRSTGYNISNGGRVNRSMPGEYNPAKRPEVRSKISQAAKGHHRNVGRKHSLETRLKISKAEKGKIVSEETRAKLRLNAKNNPNYGMRGKKTSDETKKKIRLAVAGKPKKSKGYIHITNDIEDTMIHPDLFPQYEKLGWRKGRKKFSEKACINISNGHKGLQTSLGKIWITDSIYSKTINKEELNNYLNRGWRKGRTISKYKNDR